MKRIVYYDEDPDGWMSAAILFYHFPNIDLIKVPKSGEDISLVSGYDEVYVVDHSLWSEDNLKKIQSNNNKLIWIDHHESAIEHFDSSIPGLRDINFSACELVWKYLYPEVPMPKAVFLVGDRDLWRFEDEHTTAFANFLHTIPYENIIPRYASLISKEDLSQEFLIGQQIENYKNSILQEMLMNGIKRDFDGYKAMVFDGDVLRSELMHLALQTHSDIQISVVRRTAYIKDGVEYFKYSLRSRPKSNIYVNKICLTHGGGGHYHAGGFISSKRF